jgi:hypothetical protein
MSGGNLSRHSGAEMPAGTRAEMRPEVTAKARAAVRAATCLAALVSIAVLAGCGGDDGGPGPAISVSLDLDSTGVEICATHSIEADVTNGRASEVDWYVNGILGGNSTVGTISQANPATYLAPESIPAPATVTVKVVSSEDTTKADSCRVTVKFTALHVSAASGNDATATGCITKPFKTITHALVEADSGKTVLVAPGIYDPANGEVFTMYVPAGVSLIGENRETTIVRKPIDASEAYVAFQLAGANCVIRNFTIDEDHPDNPWWSYAIYVPNIATDAVIDSVIFTDRGEQCVVRLFTTSNATVSNCLFVVDDGEQQSRGMEIVHDDVGTVVRDCVFTGFGEGIFFNYGSDALVQGCTFDGNYYGVNLCCHDSGTSNPNPDLGGGARSSLGGNVFGNNTGCGLSNTAKNDIYAKYNTWPHDPPVAGVDYINTGTGSIIVE